MGADSAKRPCPVCGGLLQHEADCLLVLARDARRNVEKATAALEDARQVEAQIYRECRARGASSYKIADVVGISRPMVEIILDRKEPVR